MLVLEYFKYLFKGFLNGRFYSLNVVFKVDIKLIFLYFINLNLYIEKGVIGIF